MNDSETLPLWTAYVWYEQRLLLCLKIVLEGKVDPARENWIS